MALHSAFVTGCAGETLTRDEWRFVQDARPAGLILFQRNCVHPAQVRALTNQFKDAVGSDNVLIMIDQEGGRVQRLKPPEWRVLPPAEAFGKLYRTSPERGVRAARLVSRLSALDLAALDINVNCAPVLDLPRESADKIIGFRTYGSDARTVVALGRAVAEGLRAGGVVPVIKHLPGLGRAAVDSHVGLPVVDADKDELHETDFAPFIALAGLPAGIVAHVTYTAYDAERPASQSPVVIDDVIRREIGFDGLLITDDLGMGALAGRIGARAEAAIAAGCDIVLHCNGDLDEMIEVAGRVPELDGRPEERLMTALQGTRETQAFDVAEALVELEAMLEDKPGVAVS